MTNHALAETTGTGGRPARPYISCVVPVYNEASTIAAFIKALHDEIAGLTDRFEILVIDDGSSDATVAETLAIAPDHRVRLLQFSRNFGKEFALCAGIDHVEGDLAVLIDADFQHPIDLIPAFLARWRQGYDMVYGVQSDRAYMSRTRRRVTRLFYALMAKVAHVPIEENAGDFRLMDRKVIEALKAMPERARFMKGLYAWVGFRKIGIPYQVAARRQGLSRFTARRLSSLALTGLISFSEVPLRIWGIAGFAIALVSLLYAVWIVIETLVFGIDVPGFATLATAIMFFGGVQLLSIGVLGEYVGRIFNEVKQRPLYLIERKYGFEEATGHSGSSSERTAG
jgi:glycosyltransferase involved in cell wall biosynthesis